MCISNVTKACSDERSVEGVWDSKDIAHSSGTCH